VALCLGGAGAAGPCAGLPPAQILQRLRNDAAAAAREGWGFAGDPLAPVAGRTFGHLVSAARY
jgi:subtilisin